MLQRDSGKSAQREAGAGLRELCVLTKIDPGLARLTPEEQNHLCSSAGCRRAERPAVAAQAKSREGVKGRREREVAYDLAIRLGCNSRALEGRRD